MAATQALILLSVLALDSLPAFHPAALGASGSSQNASQMVAPSFKCFPDFVSMTRPTRSWLLPLLSSNHSPPTAPTPVLHPSDLLQFPSLGSSLPTPGAFLLPLLPLDPLFLPPPFACLTLPLPPGLKSGRLLREAFPALAHLCLVLSR